MNLKEKNLWTFFFSCFVDPAFTGSVDLSRELLGLSKALCRLAELIKNENNESVSV